MGIKNDPTQVLRVKKTIYFSNDTFIPDCETSRLFTKVLGQKLLSIQNLNRFKEIGYTILIEGKEL